jgi:hypothetical protein
MANPAQIQSVIVDQLSGREMGVLGLVVAVRRTLGRSEKLKGDLAAMVRNALRKLTTAGTVVDADGVYSLTPPK